MSKVSDKEWYELPFPAAAPRLIEIRNELRSKNLHDTEEPPLEAGAASAAPEAHAIRTNDGIYNDLGCPRMGSAGVRFGRNVPLSETMPDTANLLNPNPRTVSLELMTRTDVPARRDRQRARGRMDPVPGARLVHAQEGRLDPHARHPPRRR